MSSARYLIRVLLALAISACNAPIELEPPPAAPPSSGCSSDTDCGASSPRCDTASRLCVGCLVDTDCDEELPRCDVALHRCIECGTAADCAEGQTCAGTGHCIDTCLGGVTCPPHAPTCDARGYCVRCMQDADCRTTVDLYCNATSGQCVGCLHDWQCPMSQHRCDPYRNECVGCLTSADCGHENSDCRAGTCIDD